MVGQAGVAGSKSGTIRIAPEAKLASASAATSKCSYFIDVPCSGGCGAHRHGGSTFASNSTDPWGGPFCAEF